MTTSDAAKTPGGDLVRVEFDQGVAWVTMNRPDKRNAMDLAIADEMNEILDALETDDRCGVLVLSGDGVATGVGSVAGASASPAPAPVSAAVAAAVVAAADWVAVAAVALQLLRELTAPVEAAAEEVPEQPASK